MIYMSWGISRYLMKRFLAWLATTAFVFSALVFILDLMSIFRRASTLPDLRTSLIVKMGLLRMPFLFEQIAPIVVLIATMVCVWSLNRKNELVVIKSTGGSFRQILLPMIGVGFLMGLLDLGIMNPAARFMMKRYEVLENRYLQQNDQQFLISENGIWTRLIETNHSRVYRIGAINRDTGQLSDVSILFFDKKGLALERRIDAVSGNFDPKGYMRLKQGWDITPGSEPKGFQHLKIQSQLQQKDIEERYLNPKLLSFWQMPGVIQLLDKSGISTDSYHLYWHATLARLVWMLGMILAGSMFLMRPLREGGLMRSCFLTLGIGIFLFIFREIVLAMGLSGTLPVYISAWVPAALSWFLPLALLIHEEDG